MITKKDKQIKIPSNYRREFRHDFEREFQEIENYANFEEINDLKSLIMSSIIIHIISLRGRNIVDSEGLCNSLSFVDDCRVRLAKRDIKYAIKTMPKLLKLIEHKHKDNDKIMKFVKLCYDTFLTKNYINNKLW